jgi:hypothetical protein
VKKIFISAIIFSFLTGCVQMQVKPAGDDLDAKAKALTPAKGKALVYIIRPTMLGKPFAHEVTMDKQKIGSTCGYYYVYTNASPGKRMFTVKGDNTSELEITAEAGKTYYVEQKVYPMVWKGGVSMSLVDQTEGKKILGQCKLSGDNLAGN